MKKKNKKNHIRMRFSTLLLCCLAIVLYAAPCGWAVDYDDGLEHDVKEDIIGCLAISNGTTVNLYASVVGDWGYVTLGPDSVLNIYSGGSVEQSVYVGPYSVLNIYCGSVGWHISINEYADVTVFGTNFAVDWDRDGTADPLGPSETEFTPLPEYGSILKGFYGNGDPIDLWFLSDIAINLKPPQSGNLEEITIDIKPGSNPNTINLKSRGVVPVAVFTITDGLDASTIDPGTVLFAGASPERWKLCDVDDDGDKDMLFHFKTKDLVELDENSTEATLTGTTFGEEDIELTDEVRIVPQKKKK